MAQSNIDVVGLDFDTIKSNLKNYLRSTPQFKDIDYESSNIGVLIDLLAYNTYLNGFYTNMVGSEMWLDSAQLRDSVVSHAKELNYTPRSFTSARAQLTVDITPSSSVQSVVVPKYTSFSSRVGANTYTFSTEEPHIVTTAASNGTYTFTATVYEGTIVNDTFVMDGQLTSQRFVLSNPNVDTKNITVRVYEDGATTGKSFRQAFDLIGVNNTSDIFFVQAAENGQYELIFGDNVFGRRPKSGATIAVTYRASSGELPNGASTFVADTSIDGHTSIATTTVATAAGGSIAESMESIRYNAPRAFVTQGRAVTVKDYEVLLKSRFPEIQAISVYGGEEHVPPQYGKVYISADLFNADGASLTAQERFLSYLKDKTPLTVRPVFIDPEFLHVSVVSTVTYDVTKTSKSSNDIKLLALAAISEYAETELNDFNTTLYYSQFTRAIDDCDPAVIGNDTEVIAIKEMRPVPLTPSDIVVRLNAPLQTETGQKLDVAERHYGHTIYSSQYVSSDGTVCILVDDSLGTLYEASYVENAIKIRYALGTVDYTEGVVHVTGLNVQNYLGPYIKLYLRTLSKNITASKNTIITLNIDDVIVTARGVTP